MPRTAAIVAAGILALTGQAGAETLTVSGQAGILGEWELTATVTEQVNAEWIGPLSLKHIGFCSADGPEEKTGEIRLHLSDPPARATATLLIAGDFCSFTGILKDEYDGVMTCPDRRGVPMTLAVVR
jgi:hypothetical protein